MKFIFWRKKTIIEILKQHMATITDSEKIEHLKAIVKEVCPNCHVSLNPTKRKTNKTFDKAM